MFRGPEDVAAKLASAGRVESLQKPGLRRAPEMRLEKPLVTSDFADSVPAL